MQDLIKLLNKHKKVLGIMLPILALWAMYRLFPYLFMERPAIHTAKPDRILENTPFQDDNLLYLTGKNLKDVIGIYINGRYESECIVTGSSEEELTLLLPGHYYQEAQELDIQVEIRVNSDLTCLSNKATVTVLPDSIIMDPYINSAEPAVLGYDGTLTQTVTLNGLNLTANSIIYVNGSPYPTTYNEDDKSAVIQIPYENWCTEKELALQAVQYYNGYPTQVKSKKFFLETDVMDLSANINQCKWSEFPFIAQSLGEMEGLVHTNSRDAFLYNYGQGQKLFGIDMAFSSDGILYGNYLGEADENTVLPKSFAESEAGTELSLLRFEELCALLHEYKDIYIYVSLQEATGLQAFYTLCQYMVTYARQEYPEILQRLIIPVRDEASYRLLLELYPSANAVYVPGDYALPEEEIIAFIKSSNIRAAILPWESLTPSLCGALKQQQCFVYASGLEGTAAIAYALANGANGISSSTLPVESWKQLEAGLQSGTMGIPPLSPEQTENCTALINYLDALDSGRYLVVFSVKDEASSQLSPDIQHALERLGLAHAPVGAYQFSYIAAIDKGIVLYEECDSGFLQYDWSNELVDLHVESGGYNAGNSSSIQINGTEYAVNHRGLNIVVYDYLFGRVMDSVSFDLFDKVSLVR